MVNPNRWSWSGGPRKAHVGDDAVTSDQSLVSPPCKPDSSEAGSVPKEKKLHLGATGVSSRRLSHNRWSWRPDTAISVTREVARENELESEKQNSSDQEKAEQRANDIRQSSKPGIKKVDAAPAPLSGRRSRPLSMLTPASLSFGASPSFSHLESRGKPEVQQQEQQQMAEAREERSSQPNPPAGQPSAGVKEVFNRLHRKFSTRRLQPAQHQQQQEDPIEPTPPPSRHQNQDQDPGQQPQQQQQQQTASRPMQSAMRRRLQLHNPQNTLRGSPSTTPVTHIIQGRGQSQVQIQAWGHVDSDRIAATLPGLDENSTLQLPPPSANRRPATATGAPAHSPGFGTASPSHAAAAADDTGFLSRFMRRRLTVKETDGQNNKKKWISATGDNTSLRPEVDQNMAFPDPNLALTETTTTEHDAQAQSGPPSAVTIPSKQQQQQQQKSNRARQAETVADVEGSGTSVYNVPRFLRQVSKRRRAVTTSSAHGVDAANPPHISGSHLQPQFPSGSESKGQAQTEQQMPSSTSAPQLPKLRTKTSFGRRFWSTTSSNDFGDDGVAKTETPAPAPAPRAVYVPKHAASDFSRTTTNTRHHRHSIVLNNHRNNSARPLSTIAADVREEDSDHQDHGRQWQQAPLAEKTEKRKSRELPSKYEAPSPQELHRRLEIIKSSEIEVVTTREPPALDLWQLQRTLSQNASNRSPNGKGPALSSSRPKSSSKRHSFNLVSDPFARDLTPPKSASPVEMEAPFHPPSHTQNMSPEQEPAQPQTPPQPRAVPLFPLLSSNHPHSRPQTQPQEVPRDREMSDYERFIAEAEAADREYHAQMWSNLARRSGHYAFNTNVLGSTRPEHAPLTASHPIPNSKRDSAYYSVCKRASMMSTTADDERHMLLNSASFNANANIGYSASAESQKALRRHSSVSRRIADYIKPPKPTFEPSAYDIWLSPPATGRANRKSIIAGVPQN
ncbi:hypothetical protein CCHL11_06118 [Colletotrichum chlorophyti]|uniref:Uncharacterized protein n=1 Tax=Colletotrichum chlorophyti TaxID=708187 RepID=A0A1Q8RT72_9PEZI|nr:hypothetical protein CCHL11_06118 [Colletotrichum chlorophyti]